MEISAEFEEDYRDRLDDALRSEHRNFAQRLAEWLNLLDNSPASSQVVAELEDGLDFNAWFQHAVSSRRGMVGSGRLDWSSDRKTRLGQTLGLVRHLASEENAGINFAMGFMYAGSNLNDNISKIVDQLIEPFGRDLWKHIVRTNRSSSSQASVPSADGVVAIDHNSAPYQSLIAQLEKLERDARSTNSIAMLPEFDRVEAEVSAGRRLLEAASARVEAIRVVLVPALKWIAERAGEGAIGVAVTAILVLIAGIFGFTLPGV